MCKKKDRTYFAEKLYRVGWDALTKGQRRVVKQAKRVKDKNSMAEVDFTDANLKRADLSGLRLPYVSFKRANLFGVKAKGAYLFNADFTDAKLCCANLQNAYLVEADLKRTQLGHAELRNAELRNASVFGANFKGALLEGADVSWTGLYGAVDEINLLGAIVVADYKVTGKCHRISGVGPRGCVTGGFLDTLCLYECDKGWCVVYRGHVGSVESFLENIILRYDSTEAESLKEIIALFCK